MILVLIPISLQKRLGNERRDRFLLTKLGKGEAAQTKDETNLKIGEKRKTFLAKLKPWKCY